MPFSWGKPDDGEPEIVDAAHDGQKAFQVDRFRDVAIGV
jgi:hypothetical protein